MFQLLSKTIYCNGFCIKKIERKKKLKRLWNIKLKASAKIDKMPNKFLRREVFDMKMKKIVSLLLLFVMVFSLTACNESNPVNKRYTEDRSTILPDIPVSNEKFSMFITSEIIPITNSVYTLSMQAQQLKAGTGNVESEIQRIDSLLVDIQTAREGLMDLNVNEDKQQQKQNILDALNNLEIQLSSYKTLLSSDKITKASVQDAIDIIMGALDTVKQHAK